MVEVVLGSLIASLPMAVMGYVLPQTAAAQVEPSLRPLLAKREKERQTEAIQQWLLAVAPHVGREPTEEEKALLSRLLGEEDRLLRLGKNCPAVLRPEKGVVHMGLPPIWATGPEKALLQQLTGNIPVYAQVLRALALRSPKREKVFGAA